MKPHTTILENPSVYDLIEELSELWSKNPRFWTTLTVHGCGSVEIRMDETGNLSLVGFDVQPPKKCNTCGADVKDCHNCV